MSAPTILVADNFEPYLEGAAEYFRAKGYAVLTAATPEAALAAARASNLRAAIVDVRLRDDADPRDTSGITVAQQICLSVPVVVLTDHPSIDTVREALKPLQAGGASAVDYVAKTDGLDVLLAAVAVASLPHAAACQRDLLPAFGGDQPGDVRSRLREVGPQEIGRQLAQVCLSAGEDLLQQRRREGQRAAHLHNLGLVASAVGIALVAVGVGLLLAGRVAGGTVASCAGILVHVVRALLSTREDAAHRRIAQYFERLEAVYRPGLVMVFVDTITDNQARDRYRMKIVDHLLQSHWLADTEVPRVQ